MLHKIHRNWNDRYPITVYKIKRHKTMDWHFSPSEKNDKKPQQAIRIYDNKNVLFEIGLGLTVPNPIQVWHGEIKDQKRTVPTYHETLNGSRSGRDGWGCPYEGRWAYMNGLEYSVERQKESQSQIFNFIIWNHVWLVKFESSAWRPIDYLISVGLTKVISWLIIPLKDWKPNINLQEILFQKNLYHKRLSTGVLWNSFRRIDLGWLGDLK